MKVLGMALVVAVLALAGCGDGGGSSDGGTERIYYPAPYDFYHMAWMSKLIVVGRVTDISDVEYEDIFFGEATGEDQNFCQEYVLADIDYEDYCFKDGTPLEARKFRGELVDSGEECGLYYDKCLGRTGVQDGERVIFFAVVDPDGLRKPSIFGLFMLDGDQVIVDRWIYGSCMPGTVALETVFEEFENGSLKEYIVEECQEWPPMDNGATGDGSDGGDGGDAHTGDGGYGD